MKEFTQNQSEVGAAIPENVNNIPDIKKYCWLDYCEKILMGSVFKANDLVAGLVDNIFENDIVRLESDIQSKSTEVQKLYHFNSETGKIEEYFKPILKACYLQDVLFQIFSITENDVQRFNFEEDKLKNLNFKLPESFKIVMLDFLNTQNKTEFRLQKLDNIISNPNTKVTIKTFDEHIEPNEHNTNFHPEEWRSLGYSRNFADYLTKIKTEIGTKRSEFLNKHSNVNSEYNKINAAKEKLKIEINECIKVITDAPRKEQTLKDELIKLWKCKESLNEENNEPLPFKIRIGFKETSNNQKRLLKYGSYISEYDPYKSEYVIGIEYKKNENLDVDAESENNNLNNGNNNVMDEVINLNGISLENLQQYRDNSLKIMSDCKAKLNSIEYILLMKHLKQNHSLWTYRDLKKDFSKHYNEETCKQINELVKLELEARINCVKAERYKNEIDKIQAQDIRDQAVTKLENFEQENQEARVQLIREASQARNKMSLLNHIGGKFQNIEDIRELESIGSKQYDAVLAWTLIYFDDDQIKDFLSYVHQQFSNPVFHEDDLRRYCQFVKYYYEVINQPLDSKTINNLCSGLTKLPRFHGDRSEVIEFIEDAIFMDIVDNNLKKTKDDCISEIKQAVWAILFNLIVIALTVAFNMIASHFFLFNWIFPMITVGLNGAGFLLGSGYIAYKFFTNRKAISEYWAYKKQYKDRLDNFYNFDIQNSIAPTRKDFEQNIEKQKHDLELQMGIADQNPAEQKENQKEKQEENQNQDNAIKKVPEKMEKIDLGKLEKNK